MHSEAGFFRVVGAGPGGAPHVELVCGAPNGLASVEEGSVEGTSLSLSAGSGALSRSSSARPPFVVGFERRLRVDTSTNPPTLEYDLSMATTTTPAMTHHLSARLTRVSD